MPKKYKKSYRIVVAYDGTDYHGWQIQPGLRTVVSTLLAAFTRVFGVEGSMIGASRTDRGVHAWGQVARLKTFLDIDPERLRHAWNNALPPSILIREITKHDFFHPQHEVAVKEYRYLFFTRRPAPHLARYGWFPVLYSPERFSYERFCAVLQLFVGTHDFRFFSKYEPGKEMIRAVDSIVCEQDLETGALSLSIKAKGFLRYQIRRMIGAAFTSAQTPEFNLAIIAHMLTIGAPAPEQLPAFDKADSSGLTLHEITYSAPPESFRRKALKNRPEEYPEQTGKTTEQSLEDDVSDEECDGGE